MDCGFDDDEHTLLIASSIHAIEGDVRSTIMSGSTLLVSTAGDVTTAAASLIVFADDAALSNRDGAGIAFGIVYNKGCSDVNAVVSA